MEVQRQRTANQRILRCQHKLRPLPNHDLGYTSTGLWAGESGLTYDWTKLRKGAGVRRSHRDVIGCRHLFNIQARKPFFPQRHIITGGRHKHLNPLARARIKGGDGSATGGTADSALRSRLNHDRTGPIEIRAQGYSEEGVVRRPPKQVNVQFCSEGIEIRRNKADIGNHSEDVITTSAPVTDLKERWPELFSEAQVESKLIKLYKTKIRSVGREDGGTFYGL
ncbi:hypothetical protein WMY93_020525 [Mugilogobius chulae]|uniref:Uncharacterized protein n=1 Tax=Mugilogobius chulae TaxID=88201 RepID=A0AAW0N9R0_9GOBI